MELQDKGLIMAHSLLDGGADPNCMNFRRKTPLIIACKAQNVKQVLLLMGMIHQVFVFSRFVSRILLNNFC